MMLKIFKPVTMAYAIILPMGTNTVTTPLSSGAIDKQARAGPNENFIFQ